VLPRTVGDELRLPLVIGLAVARVVADQAPGVRLALKWPNDLLIGGAKVCGILCERTPGGPVVAGIGLNVSQKETDFPPELRGRAASLDAAALGPVSRARMAGGLLEELHTLVEAGVPALTGELGRLLVKSGADVRRIVAGTVRLADTEATETPSALGG
jgi:BirA family biotin operon repressor/biotin-[acetyl-CoA-carboxylase] ligase